MTATPTVTFLNAAQSGFIGTTQIVNLRFDNTGLPGETGYAPYIDVILPINGADGAGVGNSPVNDGVTLLGATYLGRPLVQTPVVFDGAGNATHPFAKDSGGNAIIVTGNPGDTLLVLTLPFGSFTTEQTPADVVLRLGLSNLADVGVPLPITATGGFAFGADEFNNPGTDAPIRGAAATTQIDPVVATLDKIYLGPEQETATGPSYQRVWQVEATFADGQPFTNVVLTDRVPDGVIIVGTPRLIDNLTGTALPGTVSVTGPYGNQVVTGTFAGTITGGNVKPTLEFDFYVTEFLANGTPVLDQATGAFRLLENNAKLDADWQPIDGRDANTHIIIDPTGPEDILEAQSVAIQKYVALVSPTDDTIVDPDADGNGVPDWQPGGTLKYTLDGQVSNYFEMKNLVMKDTLGDGQTFKPGYVPQVVISEAGSVIYTGPVVYTAQPKNAAGQTFIQFDIAQTLRNAGINDDVLDGNGGGLTGNPHGSAYNQATAVVTFETTIDAQYTGPIGAGLDRYVDQGDPVNNNVLFGGQVNKNGNYIEDDSAAGVVLPVSQVDKSIYAINADTALGSTILDPSPRIQAGDLITYRLTLDLPLTSAHSVKLTDYLPLPVLRALDLDANGITDGAMIPVSSKVLSLGNIAGTSSLAVGAAGTVSGQTLTFNFGDVINAGDNTVTAGDRVTIEVVAKVADGTAGGLALVNTATVRPVVPTNPYGVPPGTPMTPSSDTETVNTLALPKLGDKAFEDLNADGIQQPGEPGIAGVTVQLYSRDTGALVGTQVTDGNGLYLFTNVKPGTYYEVWSLPSGFVRTTQDQGTDAADSDASAATGVTADFVMLGNQDDLTRDAGYWKPVKIGDTVTTDTNGNGIQDAGDTPLAGVTVNLLDGGGNVLTSTVTDALGNYLFVGLKPGTYAVGFVKPPEYVFTLKDTGGNDSLDSDADRVTGQTVAKTYISGDDDRTIDAGLYIPVKLGDRVFEDQNGNGIQDAGDTNLAGVTVNLLNGANAIIGSTTTDANGNYLFTGLAPGSYAVQVVKPNGTYFFTNPDVGSNDAIDSDTNTTTGNTPVKLYVSGDDDRTIDSGLYRLAKIGDYAFVDRNGNGVNDAGDTPLGGVTVQLINTATNTVVATATTAPDGSYLFNVPPGTYKEVFTAPAGYVPTIQGQGTPSTDSNPDATGTTPNFSVTSGGQDLTIDAGFYIPVKIGDRVFEDQNGNGIQDVEDTNLAGVTVNLLDGSGNVVGTQTTDANGNYLFTGLRPADYQVQFVRPAGFITTAPDTGANDTIDSDASLANGRAPVKTYFSGDDDRTIDAGYYRPVTIGDKAFVDINKDGLQQALEPGLAGVIVTLIDDRTGLTVGTQTTDANGNYLFTGYKPSEYHVEFVAPTGYAPTLAMVGSNRAIDSNPNAAGVAPQIRLLSGQTDLTIDAGFQDGGKVSGSVFLDLPPGICGYKLPDAVFEGIKVELITTTGLIAGITFTDAAGKYAFDNLAPSTYVVRFTNPDGTVFTSPKVAGTQGARDSDVNPATGLTDAFTLVLGQEVTQINAGLDYTGVGLTGLQPIYLPDGGGSYNFNNAGAYAIGGQGSYNMMGNGGSVYFIGGTGDNNLQGSGSSGAILLGGGGNNIMEGTAGRDIIIGGCGPNNFQGLGSNNFQGLGSGNGCWPYDLLVGGIQNDIITSNSGNAIIIGGKGNDAIDGQGVFVGGPNTGTVTYSGTTATGYTVGDHIKISGLSTVNYQVGDGVQWIENFNPGRGDTIEVWGYGAPIATGLVNGQYVMVFGPNSALVLNGYQPQNGPLLGVNYHPNQASMPGAFGHLDALPPVILAPGVDSFLGTQGDDIAIATDAFTTFTGNAGDDIAFGGEGGNLFVDGAGNDTYIGGGGNDIFRLTAGSNQVIGCSGNDVVQFDVTRAQATITTKPNGTTVVVTPQGEQVLTGVEWLSFTDQNVQLSPTSGGAVFFGTAGNDSFNITNVNDLVIERMGGGIDTAWVSVDGWTLSPEVENGRLTGNATSLTGNALNNVLVANATKASTVTGAGGNDEIWGGSANGSVLNGGAGDDVIRSGSGIETMIGGKGNDQFVVNNAADTVVENAGEGTDTAWVGVNGWTVGANVEIVRLFGGASSVAFAGNAQVVADAGGSTIVAQLGDNVFWGNGGADTFVGAAGNDIFRAGGGVTKMYGGAGNDHYVIKNLGDQAFENANEGYDTAWIAVNGWTVGNNIEVAYLSGTATTLTGNSTGGNLVANSGAGSTLTAGSGLTTFWGSSFADTFNIGTGGSTVYGYGGADDFHFGVSNWGLSQIADFSHAQGDQLDFRGSGITGVGQLTINNFADKVQILAGANEIILYGVTAPLVNSDFIFA